MAPYKSSSRGGDQDDAYQEGLSLLPAVGALGWRCLDDLVFACQVVAHDGAGPTIAVQYTDDQQVEVGLHPDEFLVCEQGFRSSPVSSRLEQEAYGEDWVGNQLRADRFERLHDLAADSSDDSASGSVFVLIASFLDHFQWLQQLVLVSKHWRTALLQHQSWAIVRLPQEIVGRSGGCLGPAQYATALRKLLLGTAILRSDTSSLVPRAKGHQVVQTLVVDGCPVTDALVLELVTQCQELKTLSLQRCSQISFLLLYELTRLAKEKNSKQERFHLEHVDVWLCRGISPAYVGQLRGNGIFEKTGFKVTGPGFVVLEVSAPTEQWIRASSSMLLSSLPDNDRPQYRERTVERLSVYFVPKSRLNALFQETHQPAKELKNLSGHVDNLPLTMIPLVCRLESVLGPNGQLETPHYSLVGVPSTSKDLIQLVAQYEEKHVQTQLTLALAAMVEPRLECTDEDSASKQPATKSNSTLQDESLDARAEKVFAMLRQMTQDLESQVALLESKVRQMTIAKDHAQQEYQVAQLELERVAKDADRALLRLAMSSDTLPPPPPPFSTISTISTMSGSTEPTSAIQVVVHCRDGDELLPPLPSDEKLQALGGMLQSQEFAVLDGFLGTELSTSVHRDIEELYLASSDEDHHSDTPAEFKLGELAGGNTGRNLRYKMEHVRGDYMLWVDETDSFCSTYLRQVLRQMDRLVLERLSSWNMELRGSSLLRKKAMATCYPGNGARYTRHCDNPNKNGRKLTAILYLNADWKSEHGGELQLHLPLSLSAHEVNAETKIAPLMDRLLLFFSDRRVPHEVLPCHERNRFALTLWYLDYDEFMSAQVFGSGLEDERDEEKRIQKEIAGFAKTSEL